MTETLTLLRQPSTDDGTFGQIFRNGQQICVTCERPWLDNKPDISCIPAGTYLCIPHNSPNHPDTWQLQDVPGRSNILIHNGNIPIPYVDSNGRKHEESDGCILVGNTYGTVDGYKAVINSVLTLDKLRATLPNEFYLTITWSNQ